MAKFGDMRDLIAALPDAPRSTAQPWTWGDTPDAIAAQLAGLKTFLWLESCGAGDRHLLLGERWRIEGWPTVWIAITPEGEVRHTRHPGESAFDFLDLLEREWLSRQDRRTLLGLFFAYETGWHIEKRSRQPKDNDTPEFVIFCPEASAFYPGGHGGNFIGSLPEPRPCPPRADFAHGARLRLLQDRARYGEQVRRIKAEIRAGNTFQANLSQGYAVEGRVDALGFALDLFAHEPAPFAACWRTPGFEIVSQSPERLLRREPDGRLFTRPIAGTLPRGSGPDEARRIEDFKINFKELAEHNMLIDLARNDLGKVSRPGSVRVAEHLTVESYRHLHHLVSEVRGEAVPGTGAGRIIAAMFPGGTITGCPKPSTMKILDELEEGARGPYTGSLGYLSADGRLDLNILIRSALVLPNRTIFRTGGGIVWDSEEEAEYRETLVKARGLAASLRRGGAVLADGAEVICQLQ